MTARDIFGLFVRIFGFLTFFYGLRSFVGAWMLSDITPSNALFPEALKQAGANNMFGSLLTVIAGGAVFYFAEAITEISYLGRVPSWSFSLWRKPSAKPARPKFDPLP